MTNQNEGDTAATLREIKNELNGLVIQLKIANEISILTYFHRTGQTTPRLRALLRLVEYPEDIPSGLPLGQSGGVFAGSKGD